MQADEYQELAMQTRGTFRDTMHPQESLLCGALGLTGEAGEVADTVKKLVFHGHELDREAIKKELGDVLWYAALIADALDLSLSNIMIENIRKLQKRYPNGFNHDASINRVE